MIVTPGHLADGREILFYDRSRVERPIIDPRDLGPRRGGGEIRYDPLTEEWVAVAEHRQGRTHRPPAALCPLCPSAPGRATEVPEPSYEVVVFENRFPSFGGAAGGDPPATLDDPGATPDDPLLTSRPATGRCEVVCFTSDHDGSFATLTHDHARLVVDAWAHRTAELSELAEVEQVFCFENRGQEIGVTLSHPHGQVYAYPFVTPTSTTMLRAARSYRDRHGGSLVADVVASELRAQERVVLASAHWVAFVPFAARWPVEVHCYPRRQVPDLPALDDEERDDLTACLLRLLRGLDALLDMPLPYVAAWYQAPVRRDRDLAWLHLRLTSVRRAPDKLKYLAGSESAMGVFLNDLVPETMAHRLRRAVGLEPLAQPIAGTTPPGTTPPGTTPPGRTPATTTHGRRDDA